MKKGQNSSLQKGNYQVWPPCPHPPPPWITRRPSPSCLFSGFYTRKRGGAVSVSPRCASTFVRAIFLAPLFHQGYRANRDPPFYLFIGERFFQNIRNRRRMKIVYAISFVAILESSDIDAIVVTCDRFDSLTRRKYFQLSWSRYRVHFVTYRNNGRGAER